MAACEKCWADAAFLAFNSNVDQATIYSGLVDNRTCSPAEQCGELHVVCVELSDGTESCRCGKVRR